MTAGSSKRPGKRKSPEELDRLAVEAVRLTYEDELERDEVAARLGMQRHKVAEFLVRARRKGLVALRTADPGLPVIEHATSARLERASGIRTVVAVKATPRASFRAATGEADIPDTPASPDRFLHRMVAAGAATLLWDRFRDGDKIAVGAGRGVRFTVEALREHAVSRPRTFTGIRIVSLTGNPPVRRDPDELASDAIAAALASVLDVVDGVEQVNSTYVADSPRAALRSVRSQLMAPTWAPDGIAPDIALIGLGVLDARHHLITSARTEQQLAPVRSILQRLEDQVFPVSSSAVMDIYDTFWLREGVLPGRLGTSAKRLVDQLNSKIVGVPRPKLDQVREKVLIAGGAHKYEGILAFLRQRDAIAVHPTVFVTDADTAHKLLEDLEPRAHT